MTETRVKNAEELAQHLDQVADASPSKLVLAMWDRAPCHRGQPIRDLLTANPRLENLYFQVAVPELSPLEHVWKVGRRAIRHGSCHTPFA